MQSSLGVVATALPVQEPEDGGALAAVDDVDADGEDLAVHGGADLGEPGRLFREAGKLPAGLLDGLPGA